MRTGTLHRRNLTRRPVWPLVVMLGGPVSAAALGDRFGVRGLYNRFGVRASDFAVLDCAFTGAPNELD